MRASPLTAQLPGERDTLGRVLVDPDLRVPGAPHIFATGDTAKAATDDKGNFSLMSCQHARRLGAFAGHNAAADLLGEPTRSEAHTSELQSIMPISYAVFCLKKK